MISNTIASAAVTRNKVVTGSSHAGFSTYTEAEKITFVNYINDVLKDDKFLTERQIVPINSANEDLFEATKDGIIFCKLVNAAVPCTIEQRLINQRESLTTFQKLENLNCALLGAKMIGAKVDLINVQDLLDGKPNVIIAVLDQIMKVHQIVVHGGGACNPDERMWKRPDNNGIHAPAFPIITRRVAASPVAAMDPLLKWVNTALQQSEEWAAYNNNNNNNNSNNNNSTNNSNNDDSNSNTRRAAASTTIANFGSDLKNSVAYLHLLNVIAPQYLSLAQLKQQMSLALEDREQLDIVRAQCVIDTVKKMDPGVYMNPEDIVMGVSRMNMALLGRIHEWAEANGIDVEAMPPLSRGASSTAAAESNATTTTTTFTTTSSPANSDANASSSSSSPSSSSSVEIEMNLIGLGEVEMESQLVKMQKSLPDVRPSMVSALIAALEYYYARSIQFEQRCSRLETELEETQRLMVNLGNMNGYQSLKSNNSSGSGSGINNAYADASGSITALPPKSPRSTVLVQAAKSQLEEVKALSEERRAQVEAAQLNLRKTTLRLKLVDQQLSEARSQLKNEQDKYEHKIAKLEEQLKQRQEYIVSLERELACLMEANSNESSNANDESDKHMAMLKRNIDNHIKEIAELRNRMDSQTETIIQLEEKVAEANEKNEIQAQLLQKTEAEKVEAEKKIENAISEKEGYAKRLRETVQRWGYTREILKGVRQDLNFVLGHCGKDTLEEFAKRCLDLDSLSVADLIVDCTRRGWLYKYPRTRDAKRKVWKKRYFVIKDDYLFYFVSENAQNPNAFLRLQGVEVDRIQEQIAGQTNCFKCTDSQGNVWTLAAEDAKQATAWVVALKKSASLDVFWTM